jgi:transposase-like protein
VDVAALTALLRILECTGYNTKTKKIISREKSNLPRFSSFQKNWEKRLKKTLSKKLPKLQKAP